MRMPGLMFFAIVQNLDAQNLDLFHKRIFVTKSGFELPYRIFARKTIMMLASILSFCYCLEQEKGEMIMKAN